jgi:hypothetical protein
MYRRSRGCATTQGSKTFLWERRRGKSLSSFPGMFLHEESTRILRRSSTIPVFHHEKNASAYRTSSEARPPSTTKSFKDSYRNIIARALKVRLGHFFFRVVKAVNLHLSSSTRFCIVLLFSRRRSMNTSRNYEHAVFQTALQLCSPVL